MQIDLTKEEIEALIPMVREVELKSYENMNYPCIPSLMVSEYEAQASFFRDLGKKLEDARDSG